VILPMSWSARVGRLLGWVGGKAVVGLALSGALLGCNPALPPLPAALPPGQARLRVAVLAPLSGELLPYGRTVRHAVELAFDEWNARRTSGLFLEAVAEDTPCDAIRARQVAERVIAAGMRFLIGGVCSEAAVPVARVADRSGALFIATSATHPLVTVDTHGNPRRLAFRTTFTYPQQGRAASRFLLQTLRADRVVVIYNAGSPFARDVTAAFHTAFTHQGGDATLLVLQPDQPFDFAAHRDALGLAEAKAVYVPDDYATLRRVYEALQQQGIRRPILGSDWWSKHELQPAAMEDVYLVAHSSLPDAGPAAAQWAARYRAAFAVEPDTLAALAYDAATLLAQGIAQAPSPTPEAVASTLRAMTYAGVTGRWRFDAHHNPLKQAFFLTVQNGRLQFAGSAPVE
ncbi:MAG: ABC transporter substrate-binding protein, partial [Anaerolineae bacterium]|nr:ABC transporter substrate-binding protein [Anaerolineae bacterium]MDW8071930.1 ABC transporter substrate-binding protein [Anaerolineae bacterium]